MASELLNQLNEEIKVAMKAKESAKVMALRTLLAVVKDQTVNAGVEPTDEIFVTVVNKAIKQRQDAIDQFKAAGRDDLVALEQAQIDLYRAYQPKQLTREEIEAIVKQAIAESGATTKKEMGKVMGLVVPKTKGMADGKLVNQVVQALLA
jgi:uncharacterized protein YqeY